MIRQERRSELRKLEKEYDKIVNNKLFQKVLHSKEFENMGKRELDLLKKKEHANTELQAQFNFGYLFLARVKELECKIMKLRCYSQINKTSD